ncbi:hypothetical protein EJB05_53292, partial [Eragrostis curvula]
MPRFRHCSFLSLTIIVYLSTPLLAVRGEVGNGVHLDLPALLSFKSYNPNATALATWTGPNPCSGSWFGIRCYRGRVVGVFLDNAALAGSVAPLLGLRQLRALAVRNNSLSGALPPLSNATSPWLRHLLVARNQLTGSLNISLGALLTLRAEHNGFSGGLDALRVPKVRSFNVSGNKLAGEISGDLARFPSSAFGGNLALCGQPLPRCVRAYNALGDATSDSNATTSVAAQSPAAAAGNSSGTVSSSNAGFSKLSATALMATGIGNAVLLTLSLSISVAMFVYVRRKLRSAKNASVDAALSFEEDKRGDDSKCQKSGGGGLFCFEGGEELRLESLLKASAEVLGKGVSGSTYKAVLEDGVVVAVKRLSALQFPACRSKAFDRHMRLVGRLRHRHVVGLRGYCNSNGERLLVYDYLPNGSLQSLLLQGHGGGTRSLDWAARKNILFGAAQGLNYIHTFPARPALVHANVKPSNILVDERGAACVSECGLMRYATNIQLHSAAAVAVAQARCPLPELFPSASSGGGGWHGYAAPELASGAAARATQESDVYSFGMVLLEVVTGHNKAGDGCGGDGEEETMGWVKIGMLCTAEAPEERPTMAQVLAMMTEFM